MPDFILESGYCYISGRLSQIEVKSLWKHRETLISKQAAGINLSRLEYCDSAGMAFLIELLASCRKANPNFSLVEPSPQLEKLIGLYDLEEFFVEKN